MREGFGFEPMRTSDDTEGNIIACPRCPRRTASANHAKDTIKKHMTVPAPDIHSFAFPWASSPVPKVVHTSHNITLSSATTHILCSAVAGSWQFGLLVICRPFCCTQVLPILTGPLTSALTKTNLKVTCAAG